MTIVERGDEQFIPDGKPIVDLDDSLIRSALHNNDEFRIFSLRERTIEKGDRFENKCIRDIKLHKNERILLLERVAISLSRPVMFK